MRPRKSGTRAKYLRKERSSPARSVARSGAWLSTTVAQALCVHEKLENLLALSLTKRFYSKE